MLLAADMLDVMYQMRFDRGSFFISATCFPYKSQTLIFLISVEGFVKDVDTGEGLEGISVSVEELNYNVTTSRLGEYWRLLMPGNYTLIAKGYGYVQYYIVFASQD